MAARRRRVEFPESDPAREYTPAEELALTRNLRALTREVHTGALTHCALEPALLSGFHERLFTGVRNHAGRIRGPGQGTRRLVYGPNRSLARDDVPGALALAFEEARRSLTSLEQSGTEEGYEIGAVRLAVWLHVEIIRIHPFEDGNGRTARLAMNWLLVRLGLRPIPAEFPRQEYLESLNAHFARRTGIGPVVDLFLRVYPNP